MTTIFGLWLILDGSAPAKLPLQRNSIAMNLMRDFMRSFLKVQRSRSLTSPLAQPIRIENFHMVCHGHSQVKRRCETSTAVPVHAIALSMQGPANANSACRSLAVEDSQVWYRISCRNQFANQEKISEGIQVPFLSRIDPLQQCCSLHGCLPWRIR